MTTLHKQNPFGLLEHSDSEGEDNVQKPRQRKPVNKENKPASNVSKPAKPETQAKVEQAPKTSTTKVGVTQPKEQEKEKHLKAKEPRKLKGTPAEPHPLDRHSGNNPNAFDKKPKKGGAGKYNTGTVKDELKGGEVEGELGGEESLEEEAPKDEGMTLEEYYRKQGLAEENTQLNEAKSKITAEQLLKEIGTAKPLQSRAKTQVDDKEVTKKKNTGDHVVGLNTEHADLLGFKTGFKTYAERKPLEEGQQFAPRKANQPRAEGESPTKVAGDQKIEGIQDQTVEEGAPKDVKQEVFQKERVQREGGQGQRDGGRRYGGGDDYNKGGDYKKRPYDPNYKRDDRGAPRGGQQGGQQAPRREKVQAPPSFEDERAFPKLG